MIRLEVKPRNCTACGICEVICSFHHVGLFGRLPSSIVVTKDKAKPSVSLTICETDSVNHLACDGCVTEESPLCVKWCCQGAIIGRAN